MMNLQDQDDYDEDDYDDYQEERYYEYQMMMHPQMMRRRPEKKSPSTFAQWIEEYIREIADIVMTERGEVDLDAMIDVMTPEGGEEKETIELHVMRQIRKDRPNDKYWKIVLLTRQLEKRVADVEIVGENGRLWWNTLQLSRTSKKEYFDAGLLLRPHLLSGEQNLLLQKRNMWTKKQMQSALGINQE